MITVKNENMIIGATINDLATPTMDSGFVAKQNSKEIVDGDLPSRVILQWKICNF
jgi:hypothetical protein